MEADHLGEYIRIIGYDLYRLSGLKATRSLVVDSLLAIFVLFMMDENLFSQVYFTCLRPH